MKIENSYVAKFLFHVQKSSEGGHAKSFGQKKVKQISTVTENSCDTSFWSTYTPFNLKCGL